MVKRVTYQNYLVAVSNGGSGVDEPGDDALVSESGQEGQDGGHDPVRSVPALDQTHLGQGVGVQNPETGGDRGHAEITVKLLDLSPDGGVEHGVGQGQGLLRTRYQSPLLLPTEVTRPLKGQAQVALLHAHHDKDTKLCFYFEIKCCCFFCLILPVVLQDLFDAIDQGLGIRDVRNVVVLGQVQSRVGARQEAGEEVEKTHWDCTARKPWKWMFLRSQHSLAS